MADAHWKVGTLTVPGSTSTEVVTGLGGTPKAIFFYGTNWTAEDTTVTSANTGLFRGMAARKFDAPSTIMNSSTCLVPAGVVHHQAAYPTNNFCMNMLDTSGGLSFFYGATVTSFDADGFTLDWGVATGGFKVVYVALMDVTNAAGYIGTGVTGAAFGFKAGATLFHTAWGGPDVGFVGRTSQAIGGAAFPGAVSGGWQGGSGAYHTYPGQSYLFLNVNSATVVAAQSSELIGPFLNINNVTTGPSGGGLTDFDWFPGASNGGMAVAWDDEDNFTGLLTPGSTAGDTATVSGLSFAPGLVVTYSISDETAGASSGVGAVGLSVATPDFQWCATIDGTTSRGAFQSFQRGFCDAVHAGGPNAGTVHLTSDGFVLTTVEDTLPGSDIAWHAFGHPTAAMWIPHIYRRLVRAAGSRGGLPPPPVTGDILLENGDRIELEEGGGVLLL